VIEICDLPDEALRGVADGSTVLIEGFGDVGMPFALTDALLRCGVRDLTIVSNNAGNGDIGLAALLAAGQARKVICSFPRQTDSYVFDELDRVGKVELELVPQGTLAERIRAGGAGIGGFYTAPVSARCSLRVRRSVRSTVSATCWSGRSTATWRWSVRTSPTAWAISSTATTARNFGPVMATAAALSIVEVSVVVATGDLDPESVVTPGIFVDRVVVV
jgi:3-oxoadipate CoA-transferase, alpha subunit